MVSNKKRLYISMYPSGTGSSEERRYHWAFLIGPKVEDEERVPGFRYHVKNRTDQGWIYEENELANVKNTTRLLARIMIAKILDEERLVGIFRRIPVVQNDPNWRCRTWIANALSEIQKDGKAVGSAVLNWTLIETTARRYVGEKTDAGRFSGGADIFRPKPTWSMLESKETVP